MPAEQQGRILVETNKGGKSQPAAEERRGNLRRERAIVEIAGTRGRRLILMLLTDFLEHPRKRRIPPRTIGGDRDLQNEEKSL